MVSLFLSCRNSYGQLGVGCTSTASGVTPTSIDFGTDFVPKMMGLGGYHSCFVSTNGTMKCIGLNGYVMHSILHDDAVVIVIVLLVTDSSVMGTRKTEEDAI